MPVVRETGVQSQMKSYQRLKKWYLMPPCLTLSIIRYGSRVKWSNPGNGVVPSLTPWCSSYWKGSLRVALNYGQLILCLKVRESHSAYVHIYIFCIAVFKEIFFLHIVVWYQVFLSNNNNNGRGLVVYMPDCNIILSMFKSQFYNIHFWTNTLGKSMNLLILYPAIGYIVPLLFYKDDFGIE